MSLSIFSQLDHKQQHKPEQRYVILGVTTADKTVSKQQTTQKRSDRGAAAAPASGEAGAAAAAAGAAGARAAAAGAAGAGAGVAAAAATMQI